MFSAKCGQRISIVGTTGSGKTILARQVSQRLKIPHVELDALHWESNWTPVETAIFRERTEKALSGDNWVVDGNYSVVRDIVWHQANTVVWLNYPLPVIMTQLMRRTFLRVMKQEELWSGNRETWQSTLSRDSILLWALSTYRQNRREYPVLFRQPEYAHLKIVQLCSPQATQNWLSGLTV